MNLPMLVVVHGHPHFDNEDSFKRWEQTVTAIVQNEDSKKYAEDVIHAAKSQLKLMESWLEMCPDERQFFVSLKLPKYQFDICLQNHPTPKN